MSLCLSTSITWSANSCFIIFPMLLVPELLLLYQNLYVSLLMPKDVIKIELEGVSWVTSGLEAQQQGTLHTVYGDWTSCRQQMSTLLTSISTILQLLATNVPILTALSLLLYPSICLLVCNLEILTAFYPFKGCQGLGSMSLSLISLSLGQKASSPACPSLTTSMFNFVVTS